MGKMVSVRCEWCGNDFLRKPYEAGRNARLGRKVFCSRKCHAEWMSADAETQTRLLALQQAYRFNLRSFAGNRHDDFTGFRELLKRAKGRKREFDITLLDLKEQWERQRGLCVYSGVELMLPAWHYQSDKIRTASLDRINSAKGYIKGNIQFVSMTINFAKNGMTHEQMLDFCRVMKTSPVV